MNQPVLTLTDGQHRFFDLLNQVSWLRSYWNMEDRSCQLDQLTDALIAGHLQNNSWPAFS